MIEGEEQEELLNTLAETPQEEVRTIEEDIYVIGVESLNGQAGDLTLKSINGENLVGEGNIALQTPLNQAQLNAVNSGIDSTKVEQIATNATNITTLQNTKQDNLTQTQLNAVNSGIDATKVAQIATNTGNITSNTNRLTTIEGKIPSTATSSNQLTDKNYVDNAIATNTANYISDDGKPFQSYADLVAYSGPLTNNDYAFVETIDQAGNDIYTRYKYNADQDLWAEEYTITNPYFTSDQWASINSGIAANDVTQIGTNKTDIAGLQTSKQDTLTTAQQAAVDSGIDVIKVQQITTNATNIAALQTGKQDKLTAGTNIQINGTTISATDTKYTAGTGLTLTGTQFSVTEPVPSGFFTDTTASQTSEGTGLTINGTAEAPFKNVELKGDTFQQTYTGKNLFHINDSGTGTGQATYEVTNGSIVIEGTGTTGSAQYYRINFELDATKTYTISGEAIKNAIDSSSSHVVQVVAQYSENGTTWEGWQNIINNTSTTVGTTYSYSGQLSGHRYYRLYFYNKTGAPTSSGEKTTYFNVQIELGSTATAYEPYVGGVPSPNPSYPQDIDVVTGEQTVKVAGKNLLDNSQFVKGRIDSGVIGYASGITSLDSTEDSISFTTNANYRGVVSGVIPVQPNTTYTFQATTTYTVSRYIDAYDKDGTWIRRITGLSGIDFTTTTPANCYGLRISFMLSASGSATLNNLMFEQSSTATAYEPYQSQSYKVSLSSKNMIDLTTLTNGYVTVTGAVNVAHTMDEMASSFIKVLPSTDYTFTIYETTSTYDSWFGIGEYTEDNVASFIRRDVNQTTTANHITFTTSSTANYIIVSARNLAGATKIQLEKSDETTSYTPYYNYALSKLSSHYDYIWNDNGTWKVHTTIGKQVYNGNQNWQGGTSTGSPSFLYAYNSAIDSTSLWSEAAGFCSRFTIETTPLTTNSVKTYPCMSLSTATSGQSYHVRCLIPSSIAATPADFKTWLATHSMEVYYVLATPTDTAITDANLIAQLEALSNATSYNPQTNIMSTTPAPNLPAILTVDTFKNNWAGTLAGYQETIKRLEARVEDLEA